MFSSTEHIWDSLARSGPHLQHLYLPSQCCDMATEKRRSLYRRFFRSLRVRPSRGLPLFSHQIRSKVVFGFQWARNPHPPYLGGKRGPCFPPIRWFPPFIPLRQPFGDRVSGGFVFGAPPSWFANSLLFRTLSRSSTLSQIFPPLSLAYLRRGPLYRQVSLRNFRIPTPYGSVKPFF